MVVADNAAVIVNQIFADPQDVGTINLWIGALLFTFQIYGDFSGYSDIAIGTSRLFGIDLMKKFQPPLFLARHSGILEKVAHIAHNMVS